MTKQVTVTLTDAEAAKLGGPAGVARAVNAALRGTSKPAKARKPAKKATPAPKPAKAAKKAKGGKLTGKALAEFKARRQKGRDKAAAAKAKTGRRRI